MNTKEICETMKITPKALRVYERAGLICPLREKNNYRNYSEEDTLRLREICILKEMGFSISDIKTLINKNKAIGSSHPFIRSLYFQFKIINNKIDELGNIATTLKNSIHSILNSKPEDNCKQYSKILDCLERNKIQRQEWIDRWDFDQLASTYDTMICSKGELNVFQDYEEVLEKVRSIITTPNSKKILDIGCGTGNLCGDLSNELEVVGIDQSIEMLLTARDKYPKMKLQLGNFLDKPYCSNHFDIVVSTYAFHHLKPQEKSIAIRYMTEYLTEHGKIVIADLMFLNEEARNRCQQTFCERKREDLWSIIADEYYTVITDLEKAVKREGLSFHYEYLVNFTWLIVIEK